MSVSALENLQNRIAAALDAYHEETGSTEHYDKSDDVGTFVAIATGVACGRYLIHRNQKAADALAEAHHFYLKNRY